MDGPTFGTRRSRKRIKALLPIRVYGTTKTGAPFWSLGYTVDLSASGAKITGLEAPLAAGDIIAIQYRSSKAKFRVIWSGEQEGTSGVFIAGVHCVDRFPNFWGLDDDQDRRDDGRAPGNTHRDRRRHTRLSFRTTIEMFVDGGAAICGILADISQGGAYIETHYPLPAGKRVQAKITIGSVTSTVFAIVRTSHAGIGMGVEFDPPVPSQLSFAIERVERERQGLKAQQKQIANSSLGCIAEEFRPANGYYSA